MTAAFRTSRPLLGAAAALLFAAGTSALAAPDFRSRTERRLAGTPAAVAVGDFVAGGPATDLAVSLARNNAIVILENLGGSFQVAVEIPEPLPPSEGGPPESESNVGASPGRLIAMDLDGDGVFDDLAGVNQDSQRFFVYENGGGAWTPTDPDAAGVSAAFALTARDWSSPVLPPDGVADLFFASLTGAVYITVATAQPGEFGTVNTFFRPTEVTVQSDVEVGDFVSLGGDAGQLDVLTLDNQNGNIVIWPGDPLFDVALLTEELVLRPVEVGGERLSPVDAHVEEFDPGCAGSCWPDALVLVSEGRVLFFQGNGDPSLLGFDDPVVVDLAATIGASARMPANFTAMAYADVASADGLAGPDGVRDLVIADAGQRSAAPEGSNWLWIVPGTGENPIPTFNLDAQKHFAVGDLGELKPGALAVTDFRGAGMPPDIVLLQADASSRSVLRNDGQGSFDAPRSYSIGLPGARGLAGGDLDGDGTPDLVAAGLDAGTISILRGSALPDRHFEQPALEQPAPAGPVAPDGLELRDLDGDGIPDVLVTFDADHVLYPGAPAGDLAPPVVLDQDGPISGRSRLGQLDGDGAADLVVAAGGIGASPIEVWTGLGDGTFQYSHEVLQVLEYADHATGRFFGGSYDDVVVAALDNAVGCSGKPLLHLLQHDGDALAEVGQLLLPPPFDQGGSCWDVARIAAGEFNGDSRSDLAVAVAGGPIVVFINRAGELTALGAFFDPGVSVRGLLAEDLDGDGTDELIAVGRTSIAVLPGLGDGSLGPAVVLASNIDNVEVAAVDLDGDQLPELLVSSDQTNDVTVYENSSVPPLVLRASGDATTRLTWTGFDTADFDIVRGDLDVLWTGRDVAASDLSCLPGGPQPETFIDDSTPLPPAGAVARGFFYLVRCNGATCPESHFGLDSAGARRIPDPEPCP